MKRNIAYKFLIHPSDEQIIMFSKTFGCARKVYNLMLEEKRELLLATGKTGKQTPARYKKRFPYLKEVDSLALANEQLHLEQAFTNYFKNPTFGFPKFKSKNRDRNSYTTNLSKGNIKLVKDSLRLPKVGYVRISMHREVPSEYILKSVTVSKDRDGKYYASLLYKYEADENVKKDEVSHIGLDYKSDGLYVDSTGQCADMPHYYRQAEKKLRRMHRQLSRKKKGSNNKEKAKARLAKISKHVANQRKDFHHKLSNEITNHYELISVEKIDMKKISKKEKKKKKRLGKSTYDNGYGQFLKMVEYKQERKGHFFIKVDEKYPSSQLCSYCGYKNKIAKDLSIRKITCPICKNTYNRDHNAAINIDREGYRKYLELE